MSRHAVPIITYHALGDAAGPLATPPGVFEAQLAALVNAGYRSATLAAVLAWVKGHASLPEKSVVITFDDGYESVYHEAWPCLRAYGFRATAFLVSDYCGRDNRWPSQPASVPVCPLMTWEEVIALKAEGWEFGAHTRSHPPLTRLTPERAEEEIVTSQEHIAAHIGQPVRVFAYPYGAANVVATAIVRRHFDGAVGARLGMARHGSDPYTLERIDAYYLTPALIGIMHGSLFRRYLGLRQILRGARHLCPDWQPMLTTDPIARPPAATKSWDADSH